MGTFTPIPEASAPARPHDEASGWVVFAGLLILMAGVLSLVSGIAAIDNANFFVNDQKFVISNLNTWGWIHAGLGVVLCATAIGVFARNAFAVWVAIVFVTLNAVAQMLFIPASPWWSISVFAIDMLALYGLIVHGFKERAYS